MDKPTIEIQKEYNPAFKDDYNLLLASLHMTFGYRHSPEDINAICKGENSSLYLATLEYHHNPEIVQDEERFYLARLALRAVGMAILVHPYKTFENNTAVIEDVAVSREFKGYGIGDLILSTLITDAREMGATRIELHSNKKRQAARSMYDKHGFKQIDTDLFRLNLEE